MVGTEGAHLCGDQKGLDGSSQPKFKPISWHRMVNHGDVFIQKLLQSAACRRFAGRRQRAGRARAQPNPLDPNTDLTCGQLSYSEKTIFLGVGISSFVNCFLHMMCQYCERFRSCVYLAPVFDGSTPPSHCIHTHTARVCTVSVAG